MKEIIPDSECNTHHWGKTNAAPGDTNINMEFPGNSRRIEILNMIKNRQIAIEEGIRLIRKNHRQKSDSVVKPGEESSLMYFQPYWEVTGPDFEGVKPNRLNDDNLIIFDIEENTFQRLQELLGDETVVLVKPGKNFLQKDKQIYEMDPKDPDQYRQLVRKLHIHRLPVIKIIHMWSKEPFDTNQKSLNRQLDRGIYSVSCLSQVLMEQMPTDSVKLLYVHAEADKELQPHYAAVSGFIKTLQLENPKFRCKTVGIPNHPSHGLLNKLLAEFEMAAADSEVRYDNNGKTRLVKHFREIEPAVIQVKDLSLTEKGTYVITGGVGGLGLIIAQYLVENYKAQLILVGRSDLNPGKKSKIERLKALGSDVYYIKADLSLPQDMNNFIKQARSRCKKINGIFHCAGVIRDTFILKKTRESIKAVLASKVFATLYLDEALKEEKLDLFVLFSSLSAAVGNVGQSDYAYANSFMDHFVQVRERLRTEQKRFGRTISINWPLWKEGGMKISENDRIDLFEKTGLEPMPTKEGIEALEFIIASTMSNCIVMYGLKDKLRQFIGSIISAGKIPGTHSEEIGNTAVENVDTALLSEKTQGLLIKYFSKILKLPENQIDPHIRFEEYGIDSIIIKMFNTQIEKEVCPIPKTLLFENQTLEQLSDYFVKNHRPELIKFFNLKSEPSMKTYGKSPGYTRWDNSLPVNRKQTHPPESLYLPPPEVFEKSIAIIGLSGRYPMARSLEEFWENLKCGKDCITEIPVDRFDYRNYYDPDPRKSKIDCKWGGFIDDVDKFDPLLFNISPREAGTIDPQERLFLEIVWETLEDTGYSREEIKRYIGKEEEANIGVFAGVTTYTYNLLDHGINFMSSGPAPWSIANRVSFVFNFQGPSMPVDTACSSSLTAIHLACESLKKGECQMSIAGGVNLYLHASKYLDMCSIKMLSKTGRCHTFGSKADGFVPGEGVGAVMLKPLSHALRDHDHIYAVIKGSSINHGGRTNGYTVPNPNAQANLIVKTLETAGIGPRSISYVEAHGTGTSLGDPIEVAGLTKAYRKYTRDKQYCPIGSVKSNIGHLEAAAGIAGITKIMLQMKHKQLVPSLHARELNPNIDFGNSPFYVQQELTQWGNPLVGEKVVEIKYPRRAAISSFGAGGSNAHVILEEYQPPQSRQSSDNRDQHILLSARNEEGLKTYASRLADFLGTVEPHPHQVGKEDDQAVYGIQKQLREMAAGILHVEPEDMEEEEDFTAAGFDPVTLAILTRRINEKYNLELLPSTLSEYPSISSLACCLEELRSSNEPQTGVLPPGLSLADIAYTLQVGREPMNWRIAAVVSNIDELKEKLVQYSRGKPDIENFFKGNLKSDKKMVECLFKGKAGEEHVKNLFEERNLEALAQLWVSGFDIDWHLLYPREKPHRISLPTYPFARSKHWIKPRTSPGIEYENKRHPHPLIDGINPALSLDVTDGLVFQKKLRQTDLIVKHHQVAGQCILPAVGYLEMAYAAISHVHEYEPGQEHEHDRINFNLSRILLMQPLAVQNQLQEVQIVIKKNNRELQFEICSKDENSKVIHARGESYINSSDTPGNQRISIDKIKFRCSGHICKETLYSKFQQIGLHYGTYFQGVEQIFFNEAEALGVLHLPSQYERELHRDNYTLHPTLMDAALQTIAGLVGDFLKVEIPPMLPFFVEKLEILQPLREKGYSYVKTASKQHHKYNVAVLDDTGMVCIKFHGVTLRELKSKDVQAKSIKSRDPLERFFYKPRWIPCPSFPLSETREKALLKETSRSNEIEKRKILIIYPSSCMDLKTALDDALSHDGDDVIHIRLGNKTKQQSKTLLEIDTGDPAALDNGMAQIEHIDYIYFLGGSENETQNITDPDVLEKSQEQGVISLFRLVKALIRLGFNRQPLQFKVITCDTQQVFPEEVPVSFPASLYGLSRSMVKEYSKWKAACIDIGLKEIIHCASAHKERKMQETVDAILLEPTDESGKEVAFRSGQRYERIIEPIILPPVDIGQTLLRTRGVYLILGGTGGIGLELSRFLAESVKARLVLVDRNPLNNLQEEKIAQIEVAGGEVLYVQADATSLESMKAAVHQAKTRFGKINGAIHSAIVLRDKILENMDEETFWAALAPKIRGSVILYEILREEPLDFMMVFSSAQSFSCNPGQSNYAAGCTFKDAFAHYLNQVVSYPVKIINWGYWGTVGVVASEEYNKRLAEQGVWPIKPEEGMEAVKRVLAYPLHQIVPIKAKEHVLKTIGTVKDYHLELCRETIPSLIQPTLDYFQSALQENSGKQEIDRLVQFINDMDELEQSSRFMLLKAFHEMGVFQTLGERHDREQLREQLKIIPRYHLLFDALLEILIRAQLIEIRDQQLFVPQMPGQSQLKNAVGSLNNPHLAPFLKLLTACVTALPGILTGEVNHMEVMFPKGSMELVENIYRGNALSDFYNKQVARILKIYIRERLDTDPDTPVQILEVGAGTGGTSAFVLEAIKEYGTKVRYTYTDVSLKFIQQGKNTFEERYPFAAFTVFDLEKSPEEQGFDPDSIDLIFASNVLHATRKIDNTLKRLKTLLKTNALLIINEVTHTWNFNTLTFGLMDGWWCYEDEENRIKGSPVLSPAKWRNVMAMTGFRHVRLYGFSSKIEDEFRQSLIIAESNGELEVDNQQTTNKTREGVRQQEKSHFHQHQAEIKNRTGEREVEPGLIDDLEKMVTVILSKVLHINEAQLEPDSSFQDYGVDSLLAVEIIDKINEKLLTSLRATDLFNFSTIRGLMNHIIKNTGNKEEEKPQIQDRQDTNMETDTGQSEMEEAVGKESRPYQLEAWEDEYFEDLFGKQDDIPFPTPPDKCPGMATPASGVQKTAGDDIAIIGMACQFPDAADYGQFWDNLESGKDSTREIPPDRWNTGNFNQRGIDSTGRWGAFLSDPMQFDASFFNISPSEAEVMDPQQRLFLQETWRALEDAGYSDRDLQEKKCGIFVGCSSGDFLFILRDEKIKPNSHYLTGNDSAILPARIAFHLNLRGPAVAIDTACSSSLAALHLASESLRTGTCDIAAAGGVMVYTTPFFHILSSGSGMLSPDGKCKTFDDEANGYVPGEGVGVLVLKPLKKALQDWDHIYGIIKGSGMNHNGKTIGITAPSAASQSVLESEVYDKFNIQPETITYIEAHGTGTRLGDSIEINALTDTFMKYTNRKQFCAVGSVKTNIGHTLAASGIASVIKVIMAFTHKKIPPSLHFKTPNRHIRFQDTPFFVNTTLRDWESTGCAKLRRAAVSAFSYSGTNVHMVLEEFSLQQEKEPGISRPAYFIPISAETGEALKRKYKELADWLNSNPGYSTADIAYTLHIGRSHFPIRSSLVVKDREDLKQKLNALYKGEKIGYYLYKNLKKFKPGKNPEVIHEGNQTIREIQLLDTNGTILSKDEYIDRLMKLASLYVNGFDYKLDWTFLYRGMNCRRIPLPGYPFARERYGVPASNRQAQPLEDDEIKELIEMLAAGKITAADANMLTEGKL